MGINALVDNLVEDYEMTDGSLFDWNNPKHAANPYSNRDPRFHRTILHNCAKCRVRSDDTKGLDPESRIQTGRKEVWNPVQLPTKLNTITW